MLMTPKPKLSWKSSLGQCIELIYYNLYRYKISCLVGVNHDGQEQLLSGITLLNKNKALYFPLP